jgi:hypothetical protein
MSYICKKFHILKESHCVDEQESYRLVIQSLGLELSTFKIWWRSLSINLSTLLFFKDLYFRFVLLNGGTNNTKCYNRVLKYDSMCSKASWEPKWGSRGKRLFEMYVNTVTTLFWRLQEKRISKNECSFRE